jgi:hypothetical protein
MTQSIPSRPVWMLLGLLGAAVLGSATLAAVRQERLRAGDCRAGSVPDTRAGALAVDDEPADRVAFI